MKKQRNDSLHHPFLIGDKIYLRALEKEDLNTNYFQWLNDQEATAFMSNGSFPNSMKKMEEYFDRVSKSDSELVLAIIVKKGNKHIGNIALHQINWLYRSAELGILIGEKDFHGKGFGSEAVKLLLGHAFNRLNLHRVFLITDCENKKAVNAFEKAGFKQEGVLRESCFRKGKYMDSCYMACLAREFMRKNNAN